MALRKSPPQSRRVTRGGAKKHRWLRAYAARMSGGLEKAARAVCELREIHDNNREKEGPRSTLAAATDICKSARRRGVRARGHRDIAHARQVGRTSYGLRHCGKPGDHTSKLSGDIQLSYVCGTVIEHVADLCLPFRTVAELAWRPGVMGCRGDQDAESRLSRADCLGDYQSLKRAHLVYCFSRGSLCPGAGWHGARATRARRMSSTRRIVDGIAVGQRIRPHGRRAGEARI